MRKKAKNKISLYGSFIIFYKVLKYRLFITISLSILVGFFDGIGIALFIPLLESISSNKNGEESNFSFINNLFNNLNLSFKLEYLLLLMIFIFLFKGFLNFVSQYYQVVLQQDFIKKKRISLVTKFNNLNYKYFLKKDFGMIQNSFTSEIDRVSKSCMTFLKTIEFGIMVCTYLILALVSNTKFTLLIIIGGLITNIAYKIINKKTKQQSSKIVKRNNIFFNLIIQYCSFFKYLKVSDYQLKYVNKLKGAALNIEKTNKKIGFLNAVSTAIREPLMIIVICSVIYIQVAIFNDSVGNFLISILLFVRVLQAAMRMQNNYNSFIAVSGSLHNIDSFMNEIENNSLENRSVKFGGFENEIDLKSVFMEINNKTILSDLNFNIKKNFTVALIGASGSGKSSLINVLAGLMEVKSGEILIDNKSLNSLDLKTYHKYTGYITQESVIFNDTIFNNVSFWDDKSDENLRKFYDVIEMASMTTYVKDCKDKEDTILGISGSNLSGGQRQRISIARELYKNPEILFMDEATSALDSETESYIQSEIDKMIGTRTIIIAAHRLSTIKKANIIILMDQGRIIDSGTFQSLKDNPEFNKMIELSNIN